MLVHIISVDFAESACIGSDPESASQKKKMLGTHTTAQQKSIEFEFVTTMNFKTVRADSTSPRARIYFNRRQKMPKAPL
jgi:hypothetical protein